MLTIKDLPTTTAETVEKLKVFVDKRNIFLGTPPRYETNRQKGG
jgi:hypothetical protein